MRDALDAAVVALSRIVRTPEGAKRYGVPIGSAIGSGGDGKTQYFTKAKGSYVRPEDRKPKNAFTKVKGSYVRPEDRPKALGQNKRPEDRPKALGQNKRPEDRKSMKAAELKRSPSGSKAKPPVSKKSDDKKPRNSATVELLKELLSTEGLSDTQRKIIQNLIDSMSK